MEDGTLATPPGHPSRSAGFGDSLDSCLCICIHQAPPAALWNSPVALDKREQNKLSPPPPSESSSCCSSTSCSHKICPAHSQALRPAEGTNPMVPGAPAWGSSPALVSPPSSAVLSVCQERNCFGLALASQVLWVQRPRGFAQWRGGGVHSRKDSRVLPSWGSPRAV